MLSRDDSAAFQSGFLVGKVLSALTPDAMKSTANDLSRLKNLPNPASRVFNWGILSNSLKQFSFTLDGELKSLIISGDTELLADVLKDIHNHFKTKTSVNNN